MGRANIDLSWLASLMTPTPTAQSQANTPDLDPGSQGQFLDPNFQDTNQPFQSPSQWQRIVHPEQSNAIDAQNNEFITKPLQAGLDNRTALNIHAGNVGLLDPSLRPNTNPLSAAASGYGDINQSPSYINQQNSALLQAQHGVPGIQASTGINTAKYQNTASAGSLERQQAEQSILNQDQVNQLQTVYGLTPAQIDLAEQQVKASSHFLPTENSIKTQALKNQQEEQSNLIPAQTSLAETQTQNAQRQASEIGNLWPYAKTALDNRAIGDAATSKFIPLQEPRGASIDSSTGMVSPFQRNPLGASQYESMISMMKDINGNDTQMVPDQNGKMVKMKVPNTLHTPFNPINDDTSRLLNTPVPLRTSSNGPSVTPDPSGSMAPPVNPSLSSNTLGTASRTLDTGYESQTRASDAYTQKQSAGNQLQQLLKKYSSDPTSFDMNSFKPLGGGADVDALTDFMSKHISSMTKEDRKTALSLLHQVQ